MKKPIFALIALSAAAWALGCEPPVQHQDIVLGTRSLFDKDTGNIPLPNDLLKDPKTGLLNVPEAPGDSPLTVEIKASIRMLNGWLTSSAITIPFDGLLDTATLTADNIYLYDITNAAATRVDPASYVTMFNIGATSAAGATPATAPPYTLTIQNKAQGLQLPAFPQGHRFMVIVTDGVKDTAGIPIIPDVPFVLLRSTSPLAKNGHSLFGNDDDQAVKLEFARSMIFAPAFAQVKTAGGPTTEHAVAFSVFSIQSGPRAVFNPSPFGPVLPTPVEANGPVGTDVKPTIYFDLPVDPATLDNGTHLFEYNDGALTAVAMTPSVAADAVPGSGYLVTISPTAPLKAATQYIAVTTNKIHGGVKPDGSVANVPAEAWSLFSLMRDKNRLITPADGAKDDPGQLESPLLNSTPALLVLFSPDPLHATQDEWKNAYGTLAASLQGIEKLRVAHQKYFDATSKATPPIETLSITALWPFTTK